MIELSRLSKSDLLLAAAAVITFLLGLTAGGVFWYLFLVVAAIIFTIAFTGGGGKSTTEPPVFEESRRFAELDPFTKNEERKTLAQKVESKVGKGDRILTALETSRADAAPYELDRIGLYLWEEHTGEWLKDRILHVRQEFERIENAGKPVSLMPLHYALRSYEKALRQGRSEPTQEEREVLENILAFMKAHPKMDTTDKIKARVGTLLASKAVAPAAPAQVVPATLAASYEQVREERFQELAKARPIPLRIESLQVFVTLNDSGDAVMLERFELVSSEGSDPIAFVPATLETDYGFVADVPKYDDKPAGQKILWNFLDPPGNMRQAQIIFEPPIGTSAISYTRHWTQFNAVYFNQRDRLDSGTPDTTENVSYPLRYRYDQFRIRISFPNRIVFPGDFMVQAWRDYKNAPAELDEAESAWATQRLDWDEKDNVVWLDISRPLTSYSYNVVWKLPQTDADELKLAAAQSNKAEELAKRLASLGNQGSPYRAAAVEAMQTLGKSLESEFGGDLRLLLYTYRFQGGKGGLVEVLERNGFNVSEKAVTIGRTPVGRSFRRKSAIAYQSVLPHVDKSFEPVPSEEGLAQPSVAVAIPLLCPEPGGRRTAVLYVSTPTPDSKLLEVWRGGPERTSFSRTVKKWYANELCNAVGMQGVLQAMIAKGPE